MILDFRRSVLAWWLDLRIHRGYSMSKHTRDGQILTGGDRASQGSMKLFCDIASSRLLCPPPPFPLKPLLSFPGHNNWKVRIYVFINVFKDSFYGSDKIVCDKSPPLVRHSLLSLHRAWHWWPSQEPCAGSRADSRVITLFREGMPWSLYRVRTW